MPGASQCLPHWIHLPSGCPYGAHLPGDVTMPSNATALEEMAVLSSYVPYLTVVFLVVMLVIQRQGKTLKYLSFIAFTVIANELVLKKMFAEPRPGALGPVVTDKLRKMGSCNVSCGMPSGHSTMAMGFLTMFIYDAIWRVMPDDEQHVSAHTGRTCCQGLRKIPIFLAGGFDLLSHTEFIVYLTVWMVLLMPVPFMRVVLCDHSAEQAMVGALLGCLYAVMMQLCDALIWKFCPGVGRGVYKLVGKLKGCIKVKSSHLQMSTGQDGVILLRHKLFKRGVSHLARPGFFVEYHAEEGEEVGFWTSTGHQRQLEVIDEDQRGRLQLNTMV